MGKALILAVGGLITAIFSRLAGDEVKSWIPWFTKRLLQIAIECLPEAQRERFSEEWASHISDVPGEIGKLVTATGCVWAALETASILTYDTPILERVSKRIVDFSAATVALLFTAPLFSLLALLIRLECGTEESILDRDVVIGTNGKSFTQYRFRVGRIRFDGIHIRSIEISGLGRFMERSKLNNLPMLINVLRGDMAIVGPGGEDCLFLHVAAETVNLRPIMATSDTDGTFVHTNISFWRIVWGRFLSWIKVRPHQTSN
jgi:hypothetical protein